MNIEDLQETAELAHLNLGDEELAAAFPAFEQMLGYFAAMQEAEAPSGLSALARTVSSAYFRHDNQNPNQNANNSGDLTGRMLDNSGERDGRFIVVPNVL
jgi:aspartyl-tRNA(Asn)/glutamyl-tRNA(Gln) amidotransferase subunit C